MTLSNQSLKRENAFAMRSLTALAFALAAIVSYANAADPNSDAPEGRERPAGHVPEFATYAQAVQAWRTPEDVNAWIGAKFEYDGERSMLLSETQRAQKPGPPIHPPAEFFAAPRGICVDLSRFGVETLRAVAPELKARYLMIAGVPRRLRAVPGPGDRRVS
jgi:hypothetical protein